MSEKLQYAVIYYNHDCGDLYDGDEIFDSHKEAMDYIDGLDNFCAYIVSGRNLKTEPHT